jgi:hypothetical protein
VLKVQNSYDEEKTFLLKGVGEEQIEIEDITSSSAWALVISYIL